MSVFLFKLPLSSYRVRNAFSSLILSDRAKLKNSAIIDSPAECLVKSISMAIECNCLKVLKCLKVSAAVSSTRRLISTPNKLTRVLYQGFGQKHLIQQLAACWRRRSKYPLNFANVSHADQLEPGVY